MKTPVDIDMIYGIDYDSNISTETSDEKKVNKKISITESLINDESFQKILKSFKSTTTECLKLEIDNSTTLNGLGKKFFVILNTKNNEIVQLIVPIFSTSKTITWSSKYLDLIIESLYANLDPDENFEDELQNKILLTLHVYDEDLKDSAFIQTCYVNNFINTAMIGKSNNGSCYKWLNSLPDKSALSLKTLKDQYFTQQLPNMTTSDIKDYSVRYANENYLNFYNPTNRSKELLIKNISTGLEVELTHCSDLVCKFGSDNVKWNNVNEDDKGVDIILSINNRQANIDVKSTTSNNLSIRSNREQTDFYAIYNTNTKYKNPKFIGYVHKDDFWNNDVKEYQGSFLRTLESLKKVIIKNEAQLFVKMAENKLTTFKQKSVL